MLALLLLFAISVVAKECSQQFPEIYQLVDFKDMPGDPASDGISISYVDEKDGPVINNKVFMNSINSLNRDRIPERVVHAKGTGAFGYFELTHDLSHICKSDFLKGVGKRTPVAVRFSTGTAERGSSDYPRDSRGFAVKFYTKEGNLDLIGFHTEMYFYKEPLHFHTVVHAVKRMPSTNLYDFNPYWDMITQLPETVNFFLHIYSDDGMPLNYRHMPGFPVHTYQVENERGEYNFVRFSFIPDCGIKSINTKDAAVLGATDPDNAVRDLYEAIKKGDFPSWTVYVQIVPMKEAKKKGAKIFDVTRKLSRKEFPLHQVGKIILNKNAEHFNNDVEKLAFCPCHLVPGIVGAPDKIFESRILTYKDAQLYRLGKNHNKIPVNCPLNEIFTYNRDGMPPVGNNEGNASNYFPNSFGGPQPLMDTNTGSRSCKGKGLITIKEHPADNTDQIEEVYNEMSDEGRQILCENLLQPLKLVKPFIQKRAIEMFTSVLPNLGLCLASGLNVTLSNYNY